MNHTQYSEAYLQAAKDYLANYAEKGDVVPTIEGLADEMGRAVKTLYNWAEQFDEFAEVMARIMAKQGRELQNKSLRKEISENISRLLLSSNHNKREKSDQDITSGGDKIQGITVEFIRPQNLPEPTEV